MGNYFSPRFCYALYLFLVWIELFDKHYPLQAFTVTTKAEAAQIAYETVKHFLDEEAVLKVYFVFHSQRDRKLFERAVY